MDITTVRKEFVSKVSQDRFLDLLQNPKSSKTWITIFDKSEKKGDEESRVGTWIYLTSTRNRDNVLLSSRWDLHKEIPYPGFCSSSSEDNDYEYHNHMLIDSVYEPLVFYREFYGVRPDFVEINQEFILFFNLAFDVQSHEWKAYAPDGTTETVIVCDDDTNIRIRKDYLIRFISAKQMIAVYEYDTTHSIESHERLFDIEDEITSDLMSDFKSKNVIFSRWGGVLHGRKIYSKIQGKWIIDPLPIHECGVWPYEDQGKISFLVGLNSIGKRKYVTIPAEGDDKNEIATFNFSLLEKYRNDPEKYSFNQHEISCGQLWGVPISFSSLTTISARIEDIQKHLPESEWQYWKAHECLEMEGSRYERPVYFGFSSSYPVDLFKESYNTTNKIWKDNFGWPLFNELHANDRYILETLTLPLSDTQEEFERAIQSLQKIVIESLNSKGIKQEIRKRDNDDECDTNQPSIELLRSLINLLDKEFKIIEYFDNDFSEYINDLKNLQDLRSIVSAHRKGKRYEKLMKNNGSDSKTKREIFLDILMQMIDFLVMFRDLADHLPINLV